MNEKAASSSVHRRPENLSVRTEEELEDFWRTILPDFVKNVDPENSGFLEDLYSDQILTHTDYESLVSGKDYMPRAQRARKLWLVLASYNLGLFRAKLAPRLLASFAEIVPDRFFTAIGQLEVSIGTEHQCLRHAIQKRVRMEKMADLLVHQRCLSLKDYRVIINETTQNTIAKWNLLLDMFPGQTWSKQASLQPELQELLRRYHVPFPDNMADFLSRGFPCTCSQAESIPPDDVQSRDTKVKSWLERKLTTVCPPSPDSSWTRVEVSSNSSTLIPVSEHDTVSLTSDMTWNEDGASRDTAMHHSERGSMKNETLLQKRRPLPPSTQMVDAPLGTEQSNLTGEEIPVSVAVDNVVNVQPAHQNEKTAFDIIDQFVCNAELSNIFVESVTLITSSAEKFVKWIAQTAKRRCDRRMSLIFKYTFFVYLSFALLTVPTAICLLFTGSHSDAAMFLLSFSLWPIGAIAGVIFALILPTVIAFRLLRSVLRYFIALWKKDR